MNPILFPNGTHSFSDRIALKVIEMGDGSGSFMAFLSRILLISSVFCGTLATGSTASANNLCRDLFALPEATTAESLFYRSYHEVGYGKGYEPGACGVNIPDGPMISASQLLN